MLRSGKDIFNWLNFEQPDQAISVPSDWPEIGQPSKSSTPVEEVDSTNQSPDTLDAWRYSASYITRQDLDWAQRYLTVVWDGVE